MADFEVGMVKKPVKAAQTQLNNIDSGGPGRGWPTGRNSIHGDVDFCL